MQLQYPNPRYVTTVYVGNYLLEVRISLGEASLLLTFADFLLSLLWPFLEAEVAEADESLDGLLLDVSQSPSPAVRWM